MSNAAALLTSRFVPRGIAAIDPQALSADYCALTGPVADAPQDKPALAVVNIRGPLAYELAAPQFFDTYDMIRMRFDRAVAAKPAAIALRIASPGGDVSGSFELARYMRAKAKAAGIKLIAHSEAQICSAAYVLACAADTIYCTETASIGSIGVIVQPCETTAADAAQGLKFEIISSGERKADGNPHVKLSVEARDAIQASVDTMAGLFFAHVGESRGDKLPAIKARALQAGIRVGHAALGAGLVDEVIDWADLCDELCAKAALTGGTIPVQATSAAVAAFSAKVSMADKDDKSDKDEKPKEDAVRASLVTASTSDDEKKAARAKAALAAYDVDEDGDDDKKKKDEKAKASAKATAEAAVASAAAEAALAASKATLAQVAAQAAAATAEIAAMKATAEATERASLFASRKDLPQAALDAVRDLPLATARDILKSLPVQHNPLAPKAVSAAVGDPTLTGSVASSLTATEAAELDAKFGIGKAKALGSVVIGANQYFGVPVDANTPGVVK